MTNRLIAVVCLVLLHPFAHAQAPPPAPAVKMTTYQLVVLRPGPKAGAIGGTPEGQKIVQAHVGYLYKLAADGLNMAAGPFLDGGDIAGVIVMKAASPERAKEIEAEDPGVKAG